MRTLKQWLAAESRAVSAMLTKEARAAGLLPRGHRIEVCAELTASKKIPRLDIGHAERSAKFFRPLCPAVLTTKERYRVLGLVATGWPHEALNRVLSANRNHPTGLGNGATDEWEVQDVINRALRRDWRNGTCYRLMLSNGQAQLWVVEPIAK